MQHVFISHATADSELAGKLCWALEAVGCRVWIAPRDVPSGSSYPRAIVNAIKEAAVTVLLLTEAANQSQHVHREVERASAFDVPIVVFRAQPVSLAEELEYFVSLNQWLDATAGELQVHLRALCDRVVELAGTDPALGSDAHPVESSMPLSRSEVDLALGFSELADRHRRLLTDFGKEVIDFLCRRPDPSIPLQRRDLFSSLSRDRAALFANVTFRQFSNLLDEARLSGCCPGLTESDSGISVIEETIATKLERNRLLKAAIGKFAAGMVTSGHSVALDGGSTTLPLVENLCERLRDGAVDGITVVTNSLAICQTFGQLILDHGWSDDDSPIRVIALGGLLRPNTLATAPTIDEIHALLHRVGLDSSHPIDLAFVGANGFTPRSGLTMGSAEELAVKRTFLKSARKPFLVADSTKFGIELPVLIADWADGYTLITNELEEPAASDMASLLAEGHVLEVRQ